MKKKLTNPFIGLSAVTLGLTNVGQAATLLTGSGGVTNTQIPAAHGSGAVGTPDINLNWSTVGVSGSDNRWEAYNSWPSGGTGGQVYQLDGPTWTAAGQPYIIDFTPSGPNIAVALTSVTLNDWVGAGFTTLNWSITGVTSGTLASGTGLVVADGTAPTLSFGVQGAGGEALKLTFSPTLGTGSYFAIDNLSFDQVTVPEPSSVALSGLALGAFALRRRRA